MAFIVKTLAGLEPALAAELRALGAAGVSELRRAVSFEGDKRMLYRANYELRTALRVLVPITTFEARSERDMYYGIQKIDWGKYMRVGDTMAVDAVVAGETFRHSHYVALLTKDAVVDQFREKYQNRPNVRTAMPDVRIHILVRGTTVEVLLDSSDESLHKRGYRRDAVEAPLNEVLAAGMLQLTGWNGKGPFVDAMCGSGTLPIEATMLAMHIPPQRTRESFGFMRWPDFDKKIWEEVKREADSKIQNFEFPVLASDKDSRARNSTGVNVMAAHLEDHIQIERMPFERVVKPAESGLLVMNPPYDERMKLEEVEDFYKMIGDTLKKNWTGWDAWIISSNREAMKHLGLKASRRITLFNGALECTFQHFEMYQGSRYSGPMSADMELP